MGILEKIAEIEREISRTQKNKGETAKHACHNVTVSQEDSLMVFNPRCHVLCA